MFENAQHVEEEMRTAEIHNQKNWRKNRAGHGRTPHRCACKIDLMKQDRAESDHCRHTADSAKEKVERNFPRPDRRFNHRLAVIAGFSRYRPTDNVDAATGDDSLLPGFLAQLFKPLF